MNCDYGPCSGMPIAVIFAVLFVLLMVFIATIIKVWLYCKVFAKAGYSWAMGLLVLVPVVHIIIPFVLALSDWPVQKELRQLKQQLNANKPQTS